MRVYTEQIRNGITANSEQHNKQNEEISDTKWENIKKVVPMVAIEVGGYEERKKRKNWYDKKWKTKVEVRNRTQIKMLNKRMKMNTENYKTKGREAKKMCRENKKEPKTVRCIKVCRKQIKEMKQENSFL
jgi:hypothetical protein